MLTQAINWHRILFINVPIGVATALLALRLLKKDRDIDFGEEADVPDAVPITASLMPGVYTRVESAADHGCGVGPTLGLGTISLVLLAAFVVREANGVRRDDAEARAPSEGRDPGPVEPADREAA